MISGKMNKWFPRHGIFIIFLWRLIMKKFVISTIFVFAVALILAACGSTPTTNGGPSSTNGNVANSSQNGEPAWLGEGFPDFICGIGGSRVAQNRARALEYAKKRGKTELAGDVKTKVQELFEDLGTEIEDGDVANSEGLGVSVARQVVDQTVGLIQPKGKWENDGYVFAIMCFDEQKFNKSLDEAIKNVEKVSEKKKEELFERKDAMLKKMDKIIYGGEEEKQEASKYVSIPSGSKE